MSFPGSEGDVPGLRRFTRDRFAFLVVPLAFYQNCTGPVFSPIADSEKSLAFSVGGGSNGGFDGMVYASLGTCASGRANPPAETGTALTYESVLVLAADLSSVTVMRQDCTDLAVADRPSYSASQFTFSSPDRGVVVMGGKKFSVLDAASLPKPVILAWSCPLAEGGAVEVYRDPQIPALFYNRYSGKDRTGLDVVTDLVSATHSISAISEGYSTAPYDSSSAASPPFIDVQVPRGAPGSLRLQSDAGGTLIADCASVGPTLTPSPTPMKTPSTSSLSLTWSYFGHISSTFILALQMPYCGSEAVANGSCERENSLCWIGTGTYYDGYANDNFFNFFSCR